MKIRPFAVFQTTEFLYSFGGERERKFEIKCLYPDFQFMEIRFFGFSFYELLYFLILDFRLGKSNSQHTGIVNSPFETIRETFYSKGRRDYSLSQGFMKVPV